jgi:CRISPR-associated endonuclease Cas1
VIRRKTLGQIEVIKKAPILKQHMAIERQYLRAFKRYWGERTLHMQPVSDLLEKGLEELSHAHDIQTVLIIEAHLAALSWEAFIGVPINWKPKDEKIVPPHWKSISERASSLSGVTARHAVNPFQSTLNYAYGILEAQVLSAINASGLDPAVGCLHQDRIGRNSLVYDFMEPHRPEVDFLVLSLFYNTTFTRGMFVPLESGEVRLSKQFARYVASGCVLSLATIADTVASFVKIYRGS